MANKTYKLHGVDGHVLVIGRRALLDNGRLPYKPVEITRYLAAAYIRFHRHLAPNRGQG